jgi:hypothetical protein
MNIDTVHTTVADERTDESGRTQAGVVDVSGLTAAEVPRVVGDEDVHLERRGGRTYLVPAN